MYRYQSLRYPLGGWEDKYRWMIVCAPAPAHYGKGLHFASQPPIPSQTRRKLRFPEAAHPPKSGRVGGSRRQIVHIVTRNGGCGGPCYAVFVARRGEIMLDRPTFADEVGGGV